MLACHAVRDGPREPSINLPIFLRAHARAMQCSVTFLEAFLGEPRLHRARNPSHSPHPPHDFATHTSGWIAAVLKNHLVSRHKTNRLSPTRPTQQDQPSNVISTKALAGTSEGGAGRSAFPDRSVSQRWRSRVFLKQPSRQRIDPRAIAMRRNRLLLRELGC